MLPYVDYFLPNEAEVVRIANGGSVVSAAASLATTGTCVVVKRGSEGALMVDPLGATSVAVEAASIQPVETTGAGDTFNAGFLTGVLEGQSRDDTLRLASAAGTLSTRAIGGTTAQPTRGEASALATTLNVTPLALPSNLRRHDRGSRGQQKN